MRDVVSKTFETYDDFKEIFRFVEKVINYDRNTTPRGKNILQFWILSSAF